MRDYISFDDGDDFVEGYPLGWVHDHHLTDQVHNLFRNTFLDLVLN